MRGIVRIIASLKHTGVLKLRMRKPGGRFHQRIHLDGVTEMIFCVIPVSLRGCQLAEESGRRSKARTRLADDDQQYLVSLLSPAGKFGRYAGLAKPPLRRLRSRSALVHRSRWQDGRPVVRVPGRAKRIRGPKGPSPVSRRGQERNTPHRVRPAQAFVFEAIT